VYEYRRKLWNAVSVALGGGYAAIKQKCVGSGLVSGFWVSLSTRIFIYTVSCYSTASIGVLIAREDFIAREEWLTEIPAAEGSCDRGVCNTHQSRGFTPLAARSRCFSIIFTLRYNQPSNAYFPTANPLGQIEKGSTTQTVADSDTTTKRQLHNFHDIHMIVVSLFASTSFLFASAQPIAVM
jgi:hypothetical protein